MDIWHACKLRAKPSRFNNNNMICIFFFLQIVLNMCVCSVTHSCLTLCDPMGCTLPDSSVHGIFQARILEWVIISYSKGSSNPGIEPKCPVSLALADEFFTTVPPGKLSIMFFQKSYYKLNEFILSATQCYFQ